MPAARHPRMATLPRSAGTAHVSLTGLCRLIAGGPEPDPEARPRPKGGLDHSLGMIDPARAGAAVPASRDVRTRRVCAW